MTMSMWLRREIRLACACGCGQMSDEQTGRGSGRGDWVGVSRRAGGWLKWPTTTGLLGQGGVGTREGWARRRDGSTLVDVDVDGGQGAGSPVCLRLHRLPSPRVRSKTLGLRSACAHGDKKAGAGQPQGGQGATGGRPLGGGSNQDRAAPTPSGSRQRASHLPSHTRSSPALARPC